MFVSSQPHRRIALHFPLDNDPNFRKDLPEGLVGKVVALDTEQQKAQVKFTVNVQGEHGHHLLDHHPQRLPDE